MKCAGMAMVEALVAAGLLGLGLLGASRMVHVALNAAEHSRQLTQAQELARQALNCGLTGDSACPSQAQVTLPPITYTVQLDHTPMGTHLSQITATVTWQRHGRTEQILWQTRRSNLPDWLGVSSLDD